MAPVKRPTYEELRWAVKSLSFLMPIGPCNWCTAERGHHDFCPVGRVLAGLDEPEAEGDGPWRALYLRLFVLVLPSVDVPVSLTEAREQFAELEAQVTEGRAREARERDADAKKGEAYIADAMRQALGAPPRPALRLVKDEP